MRGGVVHNHVLIRRLASLALSRGAAARTEVTVGDRKGGYADLVIERDGLRLLVEAELSSRRIYSDVRKAVALAADELWVVVPDRSTATRARRVLRSSREAVGAKGLRACVLTLGQALLRLERCFPLISGVNVPEKTTP